MTIATIYTRVSTDRQAKEGLSLNEQLELCRSYCKMHQHTIAGEFVDAGASGTSTQKRPQLELALCEVCSNKGVLVFYKLDRLARSVIDAYKIAKRIKDCGATFASVTESFDTSTAMGEFIYNVMAAMAAMESARIGERVRMANEASIRKNNYRTQGRCPYGFYWHKETSERRPCREEKLVIAKAESFRRDGLTYARIAGELNDLGIPSPESRRGGEGKWHGETVRRVLATR